MIFAALDFVRYKLRRGKYSAKAIRAEGGQLATSANFAKIEAFGPDHLFFYHNADSFRSWFIMYFTSSVWSHTGMFTEQGNIIDATTSGVIEHPLSDYFDGRSYIAIKTFKEKLSQEQIAGILDFSRGQIGCGFNWRGIWRLFFSIILGAHASHRPRFSADIFIALLTLWPLMLVSSGFAFLLVTIAGLYLLAVLVNTPKRLAMRRILAAP